MTAQIVPFPTAQPAMPFVDWMAARFAPRKWYVVRSRRYGGKFRFAPTEHVLLLGREYRALEAQWRRESHGHDPR